VFTCSTCNCAAGLVSFSTVHKLFEGGSGCSGFYTKLDQTLRTYLGSIRVLLLAERTKCCAATQDGAQSICGVANADNRFATASPTASRRLQSTSQRRLLATEAPTAPTPVRTVPTGWLDVTETWLSEMEATCTRHIVGGYEHIPAEFESYTNRIVCNESAYTSAQRAAFTPLAGDRYFPPWIEPHGSHSLRVSCGGQNLTLTSLALNNKAMIKGPGKGTIYEVGRKEFLGAVTGHSVSDTCCPSADTMARVSKAPNASCPDFGKKCADTRRHNREFEAEKALSEPKMCYRAAFGDTDRCEAIFDVTILKCGGCNCKDPHTHSGSLRDSTFLQLQEGFGSSTIDDSPASLVSVETSNKLVTQTAGCKAWFTFADNMARVLLNGVRLQLMEQKVLECTGNA